MLAKIKLPNVIGVTFTVFVAVAALVLRVVRVCLLVRIGPPPLLQQSARRSISYPLAIILLFGRQNPTVLVLCGQGGRGQGTQTRDVSELTT